MVRRITRRTPSKPSARAAKRALVPHAVDARDGLWQAVVTELGVPPFRCDNPPPSPAQTTVLVRSENETGRSFGVRYAVRTHTGLVRDHNEDDYVILPDCGLFVVADGMGGHAAGKVASEICVKTIGAFFATSNTLPPMDSDAATSDISESGRELERSLLRANRAIFTASTQNPDWSGMGTTVVGIRLFSDMAAISHAGDSRCYLLRNGRLSQVTHDHSLSNFLRALGREAEARLAAATMSNVIMRALGLEPDVTIESQELVLRPGDRFMLCSDGLSDLVNDNAMEAVLAAQGTSIDDCCEQLVQRALDAGGRDNITVLLIDILDAVGSARIYTGETVEVPRLGPLDPEPLWADTTGPLPDSAAMPTLDEAEQTLPPSDETTAADANAITPTPDS